MPFQFFMSLRDIGFWIRSAKADKQLASLRQASDSRQAFDQLYRNITDPFGTTLPYYRYQRLKCERVLAQLPNRRFRRALDIGCGLGVMTRMLAGRCEQVVGIDVAASAIEQARTLSTNYANICYETGDICQLSEMQKGMADLIVVADVLYYVSVTEPLLKAVRSSIVELLAPSSLLLLVHHSFSGLDMASRRTQRIHDCFSWGTELETVREEWRPFYLTTLLRRNVSHTYVSHPKEYDNYSSSIKIASSSRGRVLNNKDNHIL